MDKLEYLLEKQKKLYNEISKNRPWYKEASDNDKMLLWINAMIDECVEFRSGLNWKQWKNNKPLDYSYLKEEAIDLLHFLLDIMNTLGIDEHEIVELYDLKHNENIMRQIDGGKENKRDYVARP